MHSTYLRLQIKEGEYVPNVYPCTPMYSTFLSINTYMYLQLCASTHLHVRICMYLPMHLHMHDLSTYPCIYMYTSVLNSEALKSVPRMLPIMTFVQYISFLSLRILNS